ncbi:hypothetical protein [Streptomyces decoyicus]|uniref:hypothetical protein n=1 Tax=Streptomyces decoyicus TaxID=249567 RepID=UPI002E172200|nr:hypothetical protein OG532_28025 [Streptomyces decoyicus]
MQLLSLRSAAARAVFPRVIPVEKDDVVGVVAQNASGVQPRNAPAQDNSAFHKIPQLTR